MSLRLALVTSAVTQATRFVHFPSDEPLDQKGEERLRSSSITGGLPRIAYTSPALRAQQTARGLGFNAVVEIALRDCDHGRWIGRSLEDVHEEEPDAVAAWMSDPSSAPHGGESIADVVRRVGAWFDARRELGRIVAVTHPAIVRAAVVHALQAPLASFRHIDIEPLTRAEFSHDGRRWAFRALNSTLS